MSQQLALEIKSVLKSLILSCPRGLTISQLNGDYKMLEGRNIPYIQLGFSNLENFLRSLTDTLVVHGYGINARVSAICSEKTKHIDRLVCSQKGATRNCSVLKAVYRFPDSDLESTQNTQITEYGRLIKSQGIGLKNGSNRKEDFLDTRRNPGEMIKSVYKPEPMKCKQDVTKSTFHNLRNKESIASVNSLPETNEFGVLPKDSYPKDDMFIRALKQLEKLKVAEVSQKEVNDYFDVDAIPDLFDDILYEIDFPSDCAKYGDKISRKDLYAFPHIGKWYPISITAVDSPHKFWFQLYQEKDKLETVHENMRSYNKFGLNEYQMNPAVMRPGLLCAAPYFGKWYRAEILKYPENGKVKVRFLDYGNSLEIGQNEIKYLQKEFAELETQVFQGSLAYVKPKYQTWLQTETFAFAKIISKFNLFGYIMEIDYKKEIIHMVVSGANDKSGIEVHRLFVEKGYAFIAKHFELLPIF